MIFPRLLLLVAILMPLHAESSYRPLPLPAKDGRIGNSWEKDLAAYNRVIMEETYLKLGHRDPVWDDAALAFLRTWQALASGTEQTMTNQALLEAADALLAKGCDDPYVRYLRARSLADVGRLEEALAQYLVVWPILRGKRYAPEVKAWCGWRINDAVLTLNGGTTKGLSPERVALLQQVYPATVRHAAAMLTDPLLAKRPDDCLQQLERLFSKYDAMHDFFWKELTQTVVDWSKVDPWLGLMVRGINEKKLAWEARGNKVASEVKEEGWKGFAEHLTLSRKHLSDAHVLRPELPYAATEMIAVSMGDNQDDPRMWFDRAVAAQFDHLPAYDALIAALMPRWRGSHEQMDAFGRECLATARFDTKVPTKYFEVWQTIIRRDGDKDASLWAADPSIFINLERLYAGLVKARPKQVAWWRGQWCVAAIACQQRSRALALRASIEGALDPSLFKLFYLDPAVGEQRMTEWQKQEPIP